VPEAATEASPEAALPEAPAAEESVESTAPAAEVAESEETKPE